MSLQRSYLRGNLLASLTHRNCDKQKLYRASTSVRSEIQAYSGLIRKAIC